MRGFSLVELSIVLVILGLLVGGVMAGQSLIRAAQLRSISTEAERYTTALHAFRDKYMARPGDMANATQFWGRQVDATHCEGHPNAPIADTGACNGNGDGRLPGTAGAAHHSDETFQFWRHLALAGMIPGDYTGLRGPAGNSDALFGTNVPSSAFPQAAWTIRTLGWLDSSGNTNDFSADFGTYFIFGGKTANGYNFAQVLTPAQAWNIDMKIDDGKPGTGGMIADNRTICANATAHNDYAATYRLDTNEAVCKFYLVRR